MTDAEWNQKRDFIMHSIESHNQQLGELAESQARAEREIAQMRRHAAESQVRIDAGWDRVQLNFDRLTRAMTGLAEHSANHSRRLKALDGADDPQ